MKFLNSAQVTFLGKSRSTPQEAAILKAAFQVVNAISPLSGLDPTEAHRALKDACQNATDR